MRLREFLLQAAEGWFPEPDGGFEVVPAHRPGAEAVVSFTGHALLASELPRAVLAAAGADGLGGSLTPGLLQLLTGPDGCTGVQDVLLVHRGTGRCDLPERPDLRDHPRVRHARLWREQVQVHGDDDGLVTIAAGLAGLPELGLEVLPGRRGRGAGRRLLQRARGLVPDGEPVWLSVAPGNAAAVRCALAAGFLPVGSVTLVRPGRR